MTTQHESRQEVERAVIGCILLDGDSAMPHAVTEGLSRDWFEDPTLGRIYTICIEGFATGRAVDSITVANRLDPLEREQMLACMSDQVTTQHAPHYIEMLRIYRRYQQARQITETMASRLAGVHPLESNNLIDRLQTQCHEIGAQTTATRPLGDLAHEQVEEWEMPPLSRRNRVVWPLDILNEIIGGLTNELVYICAGESIGKTALILQLLLANERIGIPGGMASLESSVKRLVPRMISQIAQVNTLEVDRGHHTPEIMDRIKEAARMMACFKFRITDRPMNLDQLHAWSRLAVQQGAEFIVVDNTRHIKVQSAYGGDPVREYSQISLRLKQIRDDIQVPVFALHHTNKDGDVSWSRDLRKDVDVLVFMRHNETQSVEPDNTNGWVGKWVVDFAIDKNRDGRKGMIVKREFDKETQTFLQR